MLTDQSVQVDYGKIELQDRKAFDKRLLIKIDILNRHLQSDIDKLKVRIQQPKQGQYYVDITLFNNITVQSRGNGDSILKALENAFTPLKENLLQQLDKRKDVQEKSPREKRSSQLNQAYGKLQEYVFKGNKSIFGKELLPYLDDLRQYIKRHLHFAHMIGLDKEKKMASIELVNQTVEKAYETFAEKPKDYSLEHWLFAISDQQLSKALKQSQFEAQHIEDWDEYVDKALSDMDESISISAEGNPELIEDLDDTETSMATLPDQLSYELDYDKNLTDKERLAKIMKLLAKLPSEKRSIFELHTIEGFSIDEIAKIKGKNREAIEEIIRDVRSILRAKNA